MQKLSMLPGNVFSGVRLDRADHRRTDADWIEAQLHDPVSRFIPVWNQQSIVFNGNEPRAALINREALDGLLDAEASLAFLGIALEEGGIAHFAVDLSHLPVETLIARYSGGALMDLRDSVQLVPAHEAAILAYARGLMYWHQKNGYCAACGHKSEARRAGHERACANPACGAVHFPRTDSAVIVLVHDGDYCLLCRQSHWPTGMHSTLAGFLEPGESLEETVAREIFEESGVYVSDVRYHSSQPWPFPSSLMLGFRAEAINNKLDVNFSELEIASWFTKDFLKASPENDSFRMPGKVSIARRLIEEWINED